MEEFTSVAFDDGLEMIDGINLNKNDSDMANLTPKTAKLLMDRRQARTDSKSDFENRRQQRC